MAFFEKTNLAKVVLDDTERLTCDVENAQNINKHTEYILKVQRGPSVEKKWNVSRRYRDFAGLHASLQQSNVELPLPPKKLIGNMQPSFIAERQIALQNYINEVLKCPKLLLSLQVRNFLDPANYPLNLHDSALQSVSIALRGDGGFEVRGPLPDIGWRIRKHYFTVSNEQRTKNYVLSWQSYGPDKHLADNDLQMALQSIQNISHPYIDKILLIHSLEAGAYVVRNVHESGSVRDLLYGTEYNKNYLAKYGNPKNRKPFTSGQIAHYGFQILQALKFLKDKGLPYGHLHPGNIAIENQKVLLMDIENGLLGVSSLYRPYLLEHKRICHMHAIDVYCFGHTLYEMAFAAPLEHAHCDQFSAEISEDLESVLRLCLSSAMCKSGVVTLEHLLAHPFFTNMFSLTNGLAQHDECKIYLKFPIQIKENVKKATAVIETRLKQDQKLVRNAKREVRIQAILSSDEEVRKQKRKAKKRDSVWKSTSSLAETVRSHSVSTSSTPTPPHLPETSQNSTSASITPSTPQGDGRSALLSSICAFNKNNLQRVNSP